MKKFLNCIALVLTLVLLFQVSVTASTSTPMDAVEDTKDVVLPEKLLGRDVSMLKSNDYMDFKNGESLATFELTSDETKVVFVACGYEQGICKEVSVTVYDTEGKEVCSFIPEAADGFTSDVVLSAGKYYVDVTGMENTFLQIIDWEAEFTNAMSSEMRFSEKGF